MKPAPTSSFSAQGRAVVSADGAGAARGQLLDGPPEDLVRKLRVTVRQSALLLQALEGSLRPAGLPDNRVAELEAQVAQLQLDRDEIARALVESEHRTGRLANLYVASNQLHSSLDPEEVHANLRDILTTIVGADRFAVLLRLPESNDCEVALAEGLEGDEIWSVGSRYVGGDAAVDATLGDGLLRMESVGGSRALAVVPLVVEGSSVGALVVLKLFDHRPPFNADDRELLDVLAAHASSALFAARLVAGMDRRLRSLELLVKLVRGESMAALLLDGDAPEPQGGARTWRP